jgi:hypothetical protein
VYLHGIFSMENTESGSVSVRVDKNEFRLQIISETYSAWLASQGIIPLAIAIHSLS